MTNHKRHWIDISFKYIGELFPEIIPVFKGAAWIVGDSWFERDSSRIDFEASSVSLEQVEGHLRMDVTVFAEVDDLDDISEPELAQIAFALQKTLDRSKASIVQDQRDMNRFARTVHPNYPDETFRQSNDWASDWQIEGLLDFRPFKYHTERLEALLEFSDFEHWDEMCIEIKWQTKIDPAFGSVEAREIVFFETYSDYARVNIRLIDPESYVSRLEGNSEL